MHALLRPCPGAQAGSRVDARHAGQLDVHDHGIEAGAIRIFGLEPGERGLGRAEAGGEREAGGVLEQGVEARAVATSSERGARYGRTKMQVVRIGTLPFEQLPSPSTKPAGGAHCFVLSRLIAT